jgi:hypothetical protein
MSATIIRLPRKRVRKGNASRLTSLTDLAKAAREHSRGQNHADELAVLLVYVKCDPPAHQLAAELGIPAAEAARRLKKASHLLNCDEAFRDAFHAINSRLD